MIDVAAGNYPKLLSGLDNRAPTFDFNISLCRDLLGSRPRLGKMFAMRECSSFNSYANVPLRSHLREQSLSRAVNFSVHTTGTVH